VKFPLGPLETAYVARTRARAAYRRTMETCHATREWAARAENG